MTRFKKCAEPEEDAAQVVHPGQTSFVAFMQHVRPDLQITPQVELLASKIEGPIARGEGWLRLILVWPPRTGKSTAGSILFLSWLYGLHPSWDAIVGSLSGDFAAEIGEEVRNIINSEEYIEVFPGVSLSRASNAKKHFKIVSKACVAQGKFHASGRKTRITGRGAKCIPAGMYIDTASGYTTIEDLCRADQWPKVRAFNHSTQRQEWCRIKGVSVKNAREFIEVSTSSGRRIRATPEHRFYVVQRGYQEAQDLRLGDRLVEAEDLHRSPLLAVRQENVRHGLSGLLPGAAQSLGAGIVRAMSGQLQAAALRIREESPAGTEACILHRGLLPAVQQREHAQTLCHLPGFRHRSAPEILLIEMPSECDEDAGYSLSDVPEAISSGQSAADVLQQRLFKQGALAENARVWEFTFQAGRQLQQDIQRSTRHDLRARRRALRRVQSTRYAQPSKPQGQAAGIDEVGLGRPSYRQRPHEQRCDQSDNALCAVPHEASQGDTVRLVSRVHTKNQPVYDLEIEGNSNFYVNGLLVHNCLFIDDLLAEQEIDSPLAMQDAHKAIKAFRSRCNPAGFHWIICNTRYREDDPVGFIKDKYDLDGKTGTLSKWDEVIIPTLIEKGEEQTFDFGNGRKWVRPVDDVLYPYTLETISVIRALQIRDNPHEWFGQHKGMPRPPGGHKVNPADILRYADAVSALRQRCDRVTVIVDTAKRDQDQNDPSAILCIGQIGDRHYVLDALVERLLLPFLEVALARFCLLWRPHKCLIELTANGEALRDGLEKRGYAIDTSKSPHEKVPWRTPIEGIDVAGQGSKVLRFEAVVPGAVKRGALWVPESAPWAPAFVSELANFPKGHDDQCDCVAMYYKWVDENEGVYGNARPMIPAAVLAAASPAGGINRSGVGPFGHSKRW